MEVDKCPGCKNELINHYRGFWRFELDNGYIGVEIKFCPFCGKELPKEVGDGT